MEQLGNFSRTALSAGIDTDDLEITLLDGSIFPQKFFHIVVNPGSILEREIIFIEYRDNNTLYVSSRGAQGTTPKNHGANSEVIHTPLAHNFQTHVNRQTVNNPDIMNLRAGSDEFDDGVLHSDWIPVKRATNTSTVTWTEKNDVLSCYHSGTDNSGEMVALIRPMTGLTAPVTIETAQRSMVNYASNYLMWGLVFTDNPNYGSGLQIYTMPYIDTSTAGYRRSVRNGSGWVSVTDYGTDSIHLVSPLYNRIRWNGANSWEFFWSPDGVSWMRYPDSVISYSMTPQYFGVWLSHWGTTRTTISTWEYFRVY